MSAKHDSRAFMIAALGSLVVAAGALYLYSKREKKILTAQEILQPYVDKIINDDVFSEQGLAKAGIRPVPADIDRKERIETILHMVDWFTRQRINLEVKTGFAEQATKL